MAAFPAKTLRSMSVFQTLSEGLSINTKPLPFLGIQPSLSKHLDTFTFPLITLITMAIAGSRP